MKDYSKRQKQLRLELPKKISSTAFDLALNFKTPSQLEMAKDANPFLIQNLLIDDGICLCAGLPKVKKSFFIADIAVSVSTGTNALGVFGVNRRGPCLIVQGEDSESIIRQRIEGIAQSRGLSLSKLNELHVTSTQDFKLDNEEHLAQLEASVLKLGARVVVIDPLSRLMNVSDGCAAPMGRLLTNLRAFQKRTNVCLMLVTHMKKGRSSNDLAAIKGVGDLRSAYDQAILMTKPCADITQCTFDFKAVGQIPEVFFHLQNLNGGLAPIMVGADFVTQRAS